MYHVFLQIRNAGFTETLNMKFGTEDELLRFYIMHTQLFEKYPDAHVRFLNMSSAEALRYMVMVRRYGCPKCNGTGVYKAFELEDGMRKILAAAYRRDKIKNVLSN